MVDKEGQSSNRYDQELYPERVMVTIIGSLELCVDQVHCSVRTANVDDLHRSVVERYEGSEQVQVTCCEYQGKQDLTFPRDTGTRSGFPYF